MNHEAAFILYPGMHVAGHEKENWPQNRVQIGLNEDVSNGGNFGSKRNKVRLSKWPLNDFRPKIRMRFDAIYSERDVRNTKEIGPMPKIRDNSKHCC